MQRKILSFICFLFITTSLFSKGVNNIFVFNVNDLLKDYFTYKERQDSIHNFANTDCFDHDCFDDEFINDFDEEYPASGIYQNIWRRDRLNPYETPVEKLSDSILINCSNFVNPVPGHITSHFGFRRHRHHYGTDIKLDTGDSVRVVFPGKVRIIDYERKGFGRYVVVRHSNGLETVYAHFSKVLVSHDQILKAGDVIGLGGRTGRATGPHLHFEIRYLGNPINPNSIINFEEGVVRDKKYLIVKSRDFAYNKDARSTRNAQYATVRKGDTLGKIASRHRTSTSNLCKLNKISKNKIIKPGQKLRIR